MSTRTSAAKTKTKTTATQAKSNQAKSTAPAANSGVAARLKRLQELENQIRSLETVQAVITFDPIGTIIEANENFLNAMGYRQDEIVGKHHSMFVTDADRRKPDYREFWDKLGRGIPQIGQCRRITKVGQEIWLQASYLPVIDTNGRVEKVVKYAADITPERQRMADFESQMQSINTYQAVIEFKLDGSIVHANQNFLDCVGYTQEEIVGRHHRIFVDPALHNTAEYHAFWEKLGRGSADAGQYRRIARGGREVWLQASYCPIFDAEGRPFKVVKYATDITAAKAAEQEMNRVVAEAREVMRGVAEGNLENEMTGQYSGEFANLKNAINQCVRDLNQMVGQIRASSSTIIASSSEIASGNQDLSQRTEQQAASIEETASSMEELTGTVRQNADNARQANQLAANAREQAERGGSVVNNAISAMSAINEASKKIGDIIGVIDEIAFQTNLLALNAAVEAARAGEQGRGFAVVASEVRNLAQRSAGAAKEIKSLIKDSVTKVEEGSRLVNDSGETLSTIVNAVKKVSDIIAEIAEASMEQSVGIDKINQAITQMDQAVQQNAALVEEVGAASTAMDSQAQNLSVLMERFRITAEAERAAQAAVQASLEVAPRLSPAARVPARSPQPTRPAPVAQARRPLQRAAAPEAGTRGVARLAERVEQSTATSREPVAQGRWEEF